MSGEHDEALTVSAADQRHKRTFGLFETLALSVHYDFPAESYDRVMPPRLDYVPDVLETVFHETTHFNHLLTTPYGYWYTSVKTFQAMQVVAIVRLMHDYRLPLRPPLRRLIADLPGKSRFTPLRDFLLRWELAEALILYFEGQTDLYVSFRQQHAALGNRPWRSLFAKLESDLCPLFVQRGELDDYAGHNLEGSLTRPDAAEMITEAARLLEDIDVVDLLEGAATCSEFWMWDWHGDPSDVVPQGPTGKYFYLLQSAIQRLRPSTVGEFVLTFSALAELALFGPILPQQSRFRNQKITILDLNPLHRFERGLAVATKLRPVTDLTDQYLRFTEEVCAALDWPTPRLLCEYAANHPPSHATADPKAALFHRAMYLRAARPYAFADFTVWWATDREPGKQLFTKIFSHPLVEFTDGFRLHAEEEWARNCMTEHVVHQWLRSALLSTDTTVTVPYRAPPEHLADYAERAGDVLNALGVGRPRFRLRAGGAHVGGSTA